jgi:hypothetical protein
MEILPPTGAERPLGSASTALYAQMIRLYPTSFREAYGDALLELFEARRHEAQTAGDPVGTCQFWLEILVDFTASLCVIHWREWRGARALRASSIGLIALGVSVWALIGAAIAYPTSPLGDFMERFTVLNMAVAFGAPTLALAAQYAGVRLYKARSGPLFAASTALCVAAWSAPLAARAIRFCLTLL